MGYCVQSDITARISLTDLIPLLDDMSSGSLSDPIVQQNLSGLIDLESALIDGMIANIYDVPISPAPPLLRAACTIFVCEALYKRRLTPEEKNIFSEEAQMFRKRIDDIGTGKVHLDLRNPRNYPQGAVVQVPIAMNYTSM